MTMCESELSPCSMGLGGPTQELRMGCNPALILSQLTHSVQPGVFSCLPPCGTPTNQVHVRLGQKEGAGLGAGDAGHEAQKPGTSVAMGRPNGQTQVQACPHCNKVNKGGPDGGWLTPLQTSRARSAAPASTWFQRHALLGLKGTQMFSPIWTCVRWCQGSEKEGAKACKRGYTPCGEPTRTGC